MLSIYRNNTPVEPLGWLGLAIASAGIVYDIIEKVNHKAPEAKPENENISDLMEKIKALADKAKENKQE